MKPEAWMFIDERNENLEGSIRMVIGCVVVNQSRWLAVADSARHVWQVGKQKRLAQIGKILGDCSGFAIVGYSNIPLTLIESGSRVATQDIRRMSRRDYAWSVGVVFTVTIALAYLKKTGTIPMQVSLFHDPTSLTLDHRGAFQDYLRERLPAIAGRSPGMEDVETSPTITLDRIEQVSKRQGNRDMDHLQIGTCLAHHLCSQSARIIGAPPMPRIFSKNLTEDMVGQLQDLPR